jgi:hypothetical protein
MVMMGVGRNRRAAACPRTRFTGGLDGADAILEFAAAGIRFPSARSGAAQRTADAADGRRAEVATGVVISDCGINDNAASVSGTWQWRRWTRGAIGLLHFPDHRYANR